MSSASIKPIVPPYKTLDAWRGVACLAVVLFHAFSVLAEKYPRLAANPLYFLPSGGYLGVQVFFVISGYCISQSAYSTVVRSKGVSTFIQARLRRIFPAYWFSLLLFGTLSIAATWLLSHGYIRSSTLGDIHLLRQGPLFFLSTATLSQILMRQPCLAVVYWTLNYEIAFYAIVALLLLPALRLNSTRLLLNAQHGLTIFCLAALLVRRQSVGFPFDLWPQFGFGVVVYDLLSHPRQRAIRVQSLLIFGLTLLFIGQGDFRLSVQHIPSRLTFLVSLLVAISLVLLHPYDRPLAANAWVRRLAGLGIYSYSIYLVHTALIAPLSQLAKFAHFPAAAHSVQFFLLASAGVAGSWLFFICCERPFLAKKAQAVVASERVPAMAA